MKQQPETEELEFMDGFGIFSALFYGLACFSVFAYVFYELFTLETPIISAVFGTFLGLVAVLLVSPVSAAISGVLGAAASGLMMLGLRAEKKL